MYKRQVYDDASPKCEPEIFDLGIPILGICYGSQLMAHMLGGRVETAPVSEYGKTLVTTDSSSVLFEGVSAETICWMSHTDYIAQVPEGFRAVADTPVCPVAAMECPERKLYATPVSYTHLDVYKRQRLARLSLSDLSVCRLGYRDKYVLAAAQTVARDGETMLSSLRGGGISEAGAYVRSLSGVGPKVADCILLFGLLKYESFPLDVWMKRIMSALYGFKENDVKGMSEYAAKHFGKYSGFAQQYLFYYAKENL